MNKQKNFQFLLSEAASIDWNHFLPCFSFQSRLGKYLSEKNEHMLLLNAFSNVLQWNNNYKHRSWSLTKSDKIMQMDVKTWTLIKLYVPNIFRFDLFNGSPISREFYKLILLLFCSVKTTSGGSNSIKCLFHTSQHI